ncbi:MAG: cupin domain-containing protein [Planctomycetota bacterium]|nr:cupin domain-containing protein [Planctomycetota bacterium]MDA1250583.1 cupin domain-containing protein [Planctomycetota bacterium]
MQNLFHPLPADLSKEVVETLVHASSVKVERIVSNGQCSPDGFWYDQPDDEWVVVLAGSARLRFEGDDPPLEMKPGDSILIPAHRKHRVDWTSPDEPTIWLAIHYQT